jgi:hypothetical protein
VFDSGSVGNDWNVICEDVRNIRSRGALVAKHPVVVKLDVVVNGATFAP